MSIVGWSTCFKVILSVGALFVLVGTVGSIFSSNVIDKFEKKEIKAISDAKDKLQEENEKQSQEIQKTKEYQKRTSNIKQLIEKVKNGSRVAYEELTNINEKYPDLTDEENEIIQETYAALYNIFKRHIREHKDLRLVDLSSKKSLKWSLEYLYFIIISKNAYWNDKENILAVINDIGIQKHEYFVKILYEIAVNDKDMFLSLSACQAICLITRYAPYKRDSMYQKSPEKRFIYDVPEFKRLKKWWEEKGNKEQKYTCPFEKLLTTNRSYMYYERDSETQQRIDKISQILLTHPKLARTRGELAYLLLEKEDSFSEVKKHALQSMKDSDRETMPHLLLAYVALIEKNEKDCIKWISSAYKIAGKDDLLTYLRINEKLHSLIVPTFKFLEEKKK